MDPARVSVSRRGKYPDTGTSRTRARILYSPDSMLLYMKRLYRSKKDRMLGGVCGGLGGYIDLDPSIIRLAWVVLVVFSWGIFLIVYIAAWLIIPESPEEPDWQSSGPER